MENHRSHRLTSLGRVKLNAKESPRSEVWGTPRLEGANIGWSAPHDKRAKAGEIFWLLPRIGACQKPRSATEEPQKLPKCLIQRQLTAWLTYGSPLPSKRFWRSTAVGCSCYVNVGLK